MTVDTLAVLVLPLLLARTVVLVIDFDTEIAMQGIWGFLENSTGPSLPETIEAFQAIGAPRTAAILSSIRTALVAKGISTKSLRSDSEGAEPFAIKTFETSHPSIDSTTFDEVRALAAGLYVYVPEGEQAMDLLNEYVLAHADEIRAALAAWEHRGTGPPSE